MLQLLTMPDAPGQHGASLERSATALRAADLDYALPEASIARRPAEPRDAARLLVVRCGADAVEHRHVRDLPALLDAGDLLVVNDTAVAPARLVGRRLETHGRVEGLFVEPAGGEADHTWRAMLKSNGRLHGGDVVELVDDGGAATGDRIVLVERSAEAWIVRIEAEGGAQAMMDRSCRTPLPPYILRAREQRHETIDDAQDRAWYQTIYADAARRGSVAAPTAGLHFTPAMFEQLGERGVIPASVTLHVGPGTFKPVATERLDEHPMHHEWFEVGPDTLRALRDQRQRGGRIIAVGTTTVRTLESLPDPLPSGAQAASTDLLIAPPYDWRLVDGMLTNFHLPRSTLLALVAAKLGLERVLDLYRVAIEQGYRFYSYGDAMLVLP